MKNHLKSGPGFICLVIVITIAIIAIAGCVDAGQDQRSQVTHTSNPQSEYPPDVTIVTTRITTAPTTSAPDHSAPFITFDPIGDKNIGDLLIISGTTNLPERSSIYLSMANGEGDAKTIANKQVLSGTNGINRWKFAIDTGGFRPGSYKLTVTTQKKGVEAFAQFSLKGTYLGTDNPTFYSGVASGSPGAPTISVQPVGDHQQGEVFLISGSTTLAAGTILMFQVYPDYFEDKSKRSATSAASPSSIAGDTIVIRSTGSTHKWSCALDTGGYEKTNYIVNVSTISEDNSRRDIFGSAHFTIR
jgi:hypothetical protein